MMIAPLLFVVAVLLVGAGCAGHDAARPRGSASETIAIDDVSFDLPLGDWKQEKTFWVNTYGADRQVRLSVTVLPVPSELRGQAPPELARQYMEDTRKLIAVVKTTEGHREVAGRRHPVMTFRQELDARMPKGPVIDGLNLLYFPDDFVSRPRFARVLWMDGHPAHVAARDLKELDAVVATLCIGTAPSSAITTPGVPESSTTAPMARAPRPILHFDVQPAASAGGLPRLATGAIHADGRHVNRVLDDLGYATWAPDGQWFAYLGVVDGDRWVLRKRNLEGEEQTIFTGPPGARSGLKFPAWAPDGRRIALVSPTGVAIFDTQRAALLAHHRLSGPVASALSGSPENYGWSPDAKKILVSWAQAIVIDAASGSVETISKGPVIAEWAQDSRAVYYFETDDSGLTGLYRKVLGSSAPERLADAEHIRRAGLRRSRALILGRMILSPSAARLAIVGGDASEGQDRVQIHDAHKPLLLDTPSRIFRTPDAIMAVEWAPTSRASRWS
jgi:hypothetical protein